MDEDKIAAIEAALRSTVERALIRPAFIKLIRYATVSDFSEEPLEEPMWLITITVFDPKEQLSTVMNIQVPFDETFYEKYNTFPTKKTSITVEKRFKDYMTIATSVGEALKKYTGQEFYVTPIEP